MISSSIERTAVGGRRLAVACAAVAIGTLIVFVPALAGGFVNWDDQVYVVRNADLGTFDARFFQWAFSTSLCGNWHPLTLISFGVDHAVWGKQAIGYHLTNILLHAMNAGLAVWLAWSLFRNASNVASERCLAGAVAVGVVFGVHPLHVESVAWISERKDVLYAFFWLLSVIAYMAYAREHAARARRYIGFALSIVCFGLAALAKPMAVSLPIVLLILDVYPLRRVRWRTPWRVLLEKVPFLVGAIAIGLATVDAQAASGAMEGMKHIPLADRLWGAESALVFYLVKFVAPVGLVPLYPLDLDLNPLTWTYLAPLAFLIAVTAVAILYRRRAPVVAAAGAAYVVTLLPVLGIVQVGSQSAADRYMYLSMLAPLMMVGAGWAALWHGAGRHRKRASIALAIVVVGLLTARTIDQIGVWRDSVTLWEHVIASYPNNTTAHYNLGNAYRDRRDYAEAGRAWKRTVAIAPDHSLALNSLGNLAVLERSPEEAERYYRAAVEADAANAEAQYNLAFTLEKSGDGAGARRHYRIFLDLASPEHGHLVRRVRRKFGEAK